ncbi:hypothetical protein CIRMBP1271_00385 [Enterococcus cecorum]|uniref:hypothetical protein n=2 Tax=Enterococcus cecorum TaxID=44008 RepID=UPI00065A3D4F|nr:hypothetical protein [Enterococcus cecorum]KLO67555.1 hypothetical protein AA985_01260 [Enterococcus cecorum]CAI3258784.1 hypothetical protein CIRMBP1226_00128 [Enterococcus cecorum]CAI3259046.1 hypothetical protein CIRMBP1217_00101 [Enterococcus cecorum]CAI3259279.1 hypothetical protein CIRMBP1240_00129 [Enterococcus cecorum]CAI3259359.1 hypothetical protein CIRMBP1232_00129 [Enterococcus cecorum]
MELSRHILKEFADVSRGVERDDKTQYLRGTIKGSGEAKYVRIDGSESLTPISGVVDVKDGDRVLVTIENHEATILGNLTMPPSAYKEQEAIDKAEDAQGAANDANEKAETAKTLAQSAGDKADAAVVDAGNASAAAEQAKQNAADAIIAAGNASTQATEAKELATAAGQNAETAREEAALAQNAATAAQGEVTRIQGVVTDVKVDIDTALREVADQAADLQATKETLEVTYAKKTEVSDVQAALTTEISKKVGELQTTVSQTYAAKNDVVAMEGRLQSQITQTSGEVSSVVGKVEQLESDTTEAQKKVDEALEKSAAAQVAAGQAQANATAAQTAADAAKTNADNATNKANEAVQNAANAAATAAEADRKVSAAKTDLDEAKVNLENTMNRVGATEQEIAAAQQKVDAAQAAVTQAQKDAAEATAAANNAQNAANKAQTDATEAQNAATNAQKKADNAALAAGNAQAAADKAQQDVAALTKRVTSAETAITQNAEQIKLSANKTEEIGNKVDSLKLVGENLILNGYGEFGNNKNFTNYIFDGTNSYNNKPSFKTNLKTALSIGNNRISIDIDKAYQFSMNIKSDNGGKIYLGWDEYDIDGYYISPTYVKGYSNTTTALARDLNNGDTVVYLKSTANWVSSDYTHQNGLIFWNYRDSTGYLYPEGVYSRNAWIDLYTKESVNKTNNTITLKSPWTNGTIKAGTRVSQSDSQGHKYRNFTNTSVPTAWANTSFRIGEDLRLQAPYSFDEKRFSPAAKSIAFMAMWSYGTSIVDTYYINSIELKNIDDKLLIDGINNNLQNNYYSKTQTDAAIKVAADNVTTTVRKEVTTEITNVNNKVNNLSIGSDNLIVNGGFPTDTRGWTKTPNIAFQISTHLFYYNGNKKIFVIDSTSQTEGTVASTRFKVKRNTDYTISFVGFSASNVKDTDVFFLGKRNGESSDFTIIKNIFAYLKMSPGSANTYKATFNTGDSDEGYIRFDHNGSTNGQAASMFFGEVMLVEGTVAKKYQPSSADMATAEQAQQAQNDANEANGKADATEERVSVAESTLKQLSDSISMLVTDSNGSSMMTQTSGGWTFNIGAITNAIDSASNNIDRLASSLSQANHIINNLNNLANDLSKKTAYINMTTDGSGSPCIELGKVGNAFKVRITNTSVDFIEGSSKIAYVSNQALFIEKAIIKNELQIGESRGFIWKTRSNGNLGLRWFG